MNTKKVNREITVELSFEHGERLLLRKAASADYIEAPFEDFKDEYSIEDLMALSRMLGEANRIGVFTGDQRSAAGLLKTQLFDLADELQSPTRFS